MGFRLLSHKIIIILFSLFSIFCFAEVSEEQVKQFEETLNYGIPAARKSVLENFRNLKDEKTYPLIQKVIENDLDPDVLILAIRIAGDFQIKQTSASILKVLEETKNNSLKAACLRTLGKLSYQEASKKALEEMDSDQAEVKQAAVFFAGEIKDRKALEKLYEIADKMDEKEDLLQEVVQSIGKIGDKGSLEKLKEILENTGYSKYVRMYVPLALAKIGGKEVVDLLNQATRDEEYFIRIRAIYAISQLEGADLSSLNKAILSALKDQDLNIRLTAIDVVTASKDKSYLDFIKYMMDKDPDFKVRQKAFLCYSKLEDSGTVNSFYEEKLLDRGNFQYKRLILDAMKEGEIASYTSLLEKAFFEKDLGDLRQGILRLLGEKIQEDAAFQLVVKIALTPKFPGYADTVRQLRTMALQGISRRGWDNAFSVYEKIAQDPQDPLSLLALQLIGGLEKSKAQDYFKGLISGLESRSSGFKYQVLRSLSQLQPPGIEDSLKDFFMKEPDTTLRSTAAKLLRAYGLDPAGLEKEYQEARKASKQTP